MRPSRGRCGSSLWVCGPHHVCVRRGLSGPQAPHLSSEMANRSSAISQKGMFSFNAMSGQVVSAWSASCSSGDTIMFGILWFNISANIRRIPMLASGTSTVPNAHPRKATAWQNRKACCLCASECATGWSQPSHQFAKEGESVFHATRTVGQKIASYSALASPFLHRGQTL